MKSSAKPLQHLSLAKITRIQALSGVIVKADFHSVEFSDWTGIPLFRCENVAQNLNRMLRVNKNFLCQIQSAWKILLSGNQPKGIVSKYSYHICIGNS